MPNEAAVERIRDIENRFAEHDGRIAAWWTARHDQDRQDERRFAKIEATMAQQGSDLKLLSQKLVYIATAGGALASLAFQLILKVPEWLAIGPH